jgi:hypothetical protein
MVAECDTGSKNILNEEISEYVVVDMRATELTYKRYIQTKNLLGPTHPFLLDG